VVMRMLVKAAVEVAVEGMEVVEVATAALATEALAARLLVAQAMGGDEGHFHPEGGVFNPGLHQ